MLHFTDGISKGTFVTVYLLFRNPIKYVVMDFTGNLGSDEMISAVMVTYGISTDVQTHPCN